MLPSPSRRWRNSFGVGTVRLNTRLGRLLLCACLLTVLKAVHYQKVAIRPTGDSGAAPPPTSEPPTRVSTSTNLLLSEDAVRAVDGVGSINKPPRGDSNGRSRSVSPPPFPTSFPKNVCSAAQNDFRSASGLFAIITGMERSGTTIVSALIMSAPNLYSGFECGLLEAAKPSEFRQVSPFFDWMTGPTPYERLWALTDEQRETLVGHSCHAEQYIQLQKDSPLFHKHNNTQSWIVDKTPRYIYNLLSIMDRTQGVPVIVTKKTPKEQIASWRKRSDMPEFDVQATIKLVRKVNRMIVQAQAKYPGRIHVVNSTELMLHPDAVMEAAFDFLGLQWKPEYKTLDAFRAKNGGGQDKNTGRSFLPKATKDSNVAQG